MKNNQQAFAYLRYRLNDSSGAFAYLRHQDNVAEERRNSPVVQRAMSKRGNITALLALCVSLMLVLSACTPYASLGSFLGAPVQQTVQATAQPVPAPTPTPQTVTANLSPLPVAPATTGLELSQTQLVNSCIGSSLTGDFAKAFTNCLSDFNILDALPTLAPVFANLGSSALSSIFGSVFGGSRGVEQYNEYAGKQAASEALIDELLAINQRSTLSASRGFDFGGVMSTSFVCTAVTEGTP